MARFDGIRKKIGLRRRRGDGEAAATRDRPSRLTDIVVALVLGVADAMALAGFALVVFLVGMGSSDQGMGGGTPRHPGVSYSGLALAWVLPALLALSTFLHASLRMPVTAVVQGLFFILGTVLALAATNMLLSIA
ncbi:hypothetical protein [Streptomyces gilvus]|uniref:hypothetical protein n=1 Tax=Streptomyces gilvus TaxID=2920937 RepID=UPI001F0EA4A3|nr:hypothetical protein [Streptomyces sp. CME 23]MCH5677250.1 hypothetical protein [Streptomyces sp. CME 23]